jgi:hypothetical protein
MRVAGSTKMPEFEYRLASARFDALSSPSTIYLRSATIGKAEFHSELRKPRKIEITPPAYAEGIETRLSTVELTDKAEAIARTMDRDERYLVLTEILPNPEQHLVQFGFKTRLRIAPSVGSLNTIAMVSLDDRTGELRTLVGYIQTRHTNIDPARITTTFSNSQLRSTAIGLFLALRPFDNVIEGINGLNYHIPSGGTGEEIGSYRGLGWLTPEHHQLRASSTGTLIYEIRFADAANRKKVVTIKLDARTNSPMSYLCVDWRSMGGLGVEGLEPLKQGKGPSSFQLRDADGVAISTKIVDQPLKMGETIPCIVEIDTKTRVIGAINIKSGFGVFNESSRKLYFKADPKRLTKLIKPLNSFAVVK